MTNFWAHIREDMRVIVEDDEDILMAEEALCSTLVSAVYISSVLKTISEYFLARARASHSKFGQFDSFLAALDGSFQPQEEPHLVQETQDVFYQEQDPQ